MSGSLYARYVPSKSLTTTQTVEAEPVRTVVEHENSEKSSKKDRKVKKTTKIKSQDEDITEPKPPKKEKKSKKRKIDETGLAEDNDEPVQRPKAYEKAFARFEKSAEIAERLRAKEAKHVVEEPDKLQEPEPELHDLVPLPQPPHARRERYNPDFSSLPEWISKPLIVDPQSTKPFSELGLSDKLLENLQKKNFADALPVQAALIPLQTSGVSSYYGDICVSAPTGSGKTLGYVLPLIEKLKNTIVPRLRAIIVVPTRELVAQVRQEAEICSAGTKIRIGIAQGSTPWAIEQQQLVRRDQKYDAERHAEMQHIADERIATGFMEDDNLLQDLQTLLPGHIPDYSSRIDLLICTPGRLVEHIRSTSGFSLKDVEHLVIDEADKLLDDKFQQWVDIILSSLESDYKASNTYEVLSEYPTLTKPFYVQKVILSATMTKDLAKLAALRLIRPMLVAVSAATEDDTLIQQRSIIEEAELPPTLSEWAIPAEEGADKPLRLLLLLEDHMNIHEGNTSHKRILIFTNKNEDAMRLSFILSSMRPYLKDAIGTLAKTTSIEGRKTLSDLKQGKIVLLISSDKASRGLDVTDLTDVINYDMPGNQNDYIHRVGRTARAGKSGSAWTLFTKVQGRWFWRNIARSTTIRRPAGEVRRLRVDVPDEGIVRDQYETALESLKTAVLGAT